MKRKNAQVVANETKQSPGPAIRAWFYSFGVLILALLPRIWDLSAMITPDERRWVERSVAFFSALVERDWISTFQTGHPGVTTMWTGTLGLWGKYLLENPGVTVLEYLSQVTTRPSVTLEYLAPSRLPTAILSALSVLLVYLLLKRLFGDLSALLAAVLLALDPFYLAHSRVIHHDALATMFSMIALIAFLGYVWRRQSPLWLVLSGVSTGLAFLSKGSALFLIPFAGLVLLWAVWARVRLQPETWRQALIAHIRIGLIYLGIAVVVFVLLWPAMWVDPAGTLYGMLDKAVGYAQEAHTKGNFFMGQPVEDPGLLFYPLIFLLRTTPISLLGLLLFVAQIVLYARRYGFASLIDSPGAQAQVSLLLYVVLFTFFMGFGSKKFDRYLLPIFPAVDILAGIAIAQAARWVMVAPPADAQRTALPETASPAVAWVVVVAILVMQGLASLPQHPYYLSAYNILAGGPWLALKTVLVGWGEGLEQAAFYLNKQPDAENVKASLFYYRDFITFFDGEGEKLVDDNPDNPVPWQASDYVVFYINQAQRQIPDEATVDYFQSQSPEFSFSRNGIPYTEVYRTPSVVPDELLPGKHLQRVDFGGQLEFLGYTLGSEMDPVEEGIVFHLYWRALTDLDEDYQIQLELVDDAGNVQAVTRGLLYAKGASTRDWPAQYVAHAPFEFPATEGLPPGLARYSFLLTVSPGDQSVILAQ